MNYTEIREKLSKAYSRQKIKAYKIFSGLKSKSYTIGEKCYTIGHNLKEAIPRNKTELLELLDTAKYKIRNFPKRYEKPIPEASGDLDVKFRHNWVEQTNINDSDELYFEAVNKKVIDEKDTVYTVDIVCEKDKQDLELKRDYLNLYDDSGDVERQYHKDMIYDVYIRIEVMHTNESDDIDHHLTTTQTGRIHKEAQGIRALESKLNELIKKYDQDTLRKMIRDLQEQNEIYVE